LRQQAEMWGMETIVTAMQILSEAKTLMSRSINARPIAELALIRLCHLGDLKTLAHALRVMESGQPLVLAGPTATPVATVAATENSKREGISIPEKKNPVIESESVPETGTGAQQGVCQIDLTDQNKRKFLSQLISVIEDKVKPHLSSSVESAIYGPNQLEILFPAKYDLSRRYCERPETLKLIESTASKVAGRPIQIRIGMDRGAISEEEQPGIQSNPVSVTRSLSTDLADIHDPLVHQAVEIFQANVVKVQPRGNPSANQNE